MKDILKNEGQIPQLGKHVALVAGNGQFPLDIAKKLISEKKEISVIAFQDETDLEFNQLDCRQIAWIKIGQLSKLLAFIKKAKVSELIFAGGISRVKLFRNFVPDLKAMSLAAKLGTIKDDLLLRALAMQIEDMGVRVINGASYLDNAIPKAGLLTKRALSPNEIADAIVGWNAAKLIGQAEIGQSVLVYNSLIVAVEAVEGTDSAIDRAGSLSQLSERLPKHSGLVLVKVCKPHQDKRLDLPSFGPRTITEMLKAGVTAAIIEAEASLLIDPLAVVDLANKNEIALYAARSEAELQSLAAIDVNPAKRNFTVKAQPV